MTLSAFFSAGVFAFFAVFLRVGAILMTVPIFGEDFVAPRIRLILALLVTVLIAPALLDRLPAEPAQPSELLFFVLRETGIGVTIGLAARILMSALALAGSVIAAQAGLSFASQVDPTQGGQGATVGVLMSLLGTLLIFATDSHILFFRAMVDSYEVFRPTAPPPLGDFTELMTRLVAYSFLLGLQLSAPFVVFGIVINVGLGVLNKLMPTMQVFFVLLPVQIAAAFFAYAGTLKPAMSWFMSAFEARMAEFLLAR